MHPVILKIEHIAIYSYGLMLSIGFLVAVYMAIRTARKEGVSQNLIMDMALWGLISGLIGARLLYVFLNFSYYARNPLEILMLTHGGLVFYGGFLTGAAGALLFLKRKGANIGLITDIVAPYIPLGQAFGRIGCYLNGCCYGKVTAHRISVIFPLDSVAGEAHPYQPLIPVQIYSAMALVGIFLLLKFFSEKKLFRNNLLFVYGVIYSPARFIIEFFRGDNPALLWNLTVSQAISAVIFLLCGAYLLWKYTISKSQKRIQAKG
ncbi:MAG: prolipoprotein diacylglyceryl transferase [Candidatus Omnitrophica bacterium]|nr:prolipoprotein diacylglyceryl transferase [Candidatus Omnitrophota bacterium]